MSDHFDATKSLVISFCLYDYATKTLPHPRDIPDPIGVTKMKWVPQTASDSIWKLYEFETIEARNMFQTNPPKVFSKAKISEQPQNFYDRWCGLHSQPATHGGEVK
jgi:hypothetical protein